MNYNILISGLNLALAGRLIAKQVTVDEILQT